MVLVLCIGDFHVPYRSSGMPKKFLGDFDLEEEYPAEKARFDAARTSLVSLKIKSVILQL
eukprot:jgi/Pico_ML_1/55622/g1286.t1